MLIAKQSQLHHWESKVECVELLPVTLVVISSGNGGVFLVPQTNMLKNTKITMSSPSGQLHTCHIYNHYHYIYEVFSFHFNVSKMYRAVKQGPSVFIGNFVFHLLKPFEEAGGLLLTQTQSPEK